METSRLWLEVGIPERELPRTRAGSLVRVRVAAYPDRVFTGRIASIAPELAPQTRTATARVTLETPGNLLRPGMFATVAVGSGVTGTSAAVPESALQTVENRPVVYVAVDPETFQRRPVELGAKEEGWVQVVRGLSPGEKVAATGAFFLKSEDQRETMGGHSH
ncbi:MAG: efflux RND transporter periplasmic adaptor subunit, partial [Candidatus Methylomirabilis sp.]|nr:efflux RND transporter periplasmic adaptor subunit [Deltaproteobacteria bacterium]